MELKLYLGILLKRLWIVLLLPVLAGTAAAYVNFYVLVPEYESNTTLYVNNRTNDPGMAVDYAGLMAGNYLVKDYRELAKSRAVTLEVINRLKLKNVTPEGLASAISVNSKNETRMIEIRVRHQNPKLAKEIADSVSEVFMGKIIELMKVENVNIIDTAQLPAQPVTQSPARNTAIAVFIGLMAAIGLIFLVEYLDDTIKTPEDVEKYLGLTVLGTIPMLDIK